MSTSSMTSCPESSSVSLKSVDISDDFPAPVLPTIPTFSPPPGKEHQMNIYLMNKIGFAFKFPWILILSILTNVQRQF